MERKDPLLETKLDILKFIHQDQRSEMQYRREREYRIFTWSGSILSALIGALLITKRTDILWTSYGIWGNLVASAAVLLIVIYSTQWHARNRRFRAQNAQVVSRVDKLLHCFDKDYFTADEIALFPDEWGDYGKSKKNSAVRSIGSRLLAANYISATVLLGALAVIMIWLP